MPAASTETEPQASQAPSPLLRRAGVHLAVTFAVTFGCAVAVIGMIHENHHASDRLAVQMLAQGYAQRIQERLQTALVSTYVLASVVQQSGGRIANFEDVAAELVTLFPGVSAMQLAPNGVIDRIYPLAGNEAALGHDLLADRRRNREAVNAITTQQLTLAGPFNLVQGGIGAAGRLPVFITDARHERHFWGFAIALIRIPTLLDAAGLNTLAKSGYRYQVWRVHPDTEKKEIFARSDDGPLPDPAEYVITVHNGRWILSLVPKDGWTTPTDRIETLGFGFGVALILTLLQAFGLRVLLQKRDD